MQVLLTSTVELLALAATLVMVLDFVSGLVNLYNAQHATTQENKPEEAIPKVLPRQIAVEPVLIDLEETPTLDDPWLAEIEVVVDPFCYYAPATPECKGALIAPKRIYLLPPALSVVNQPEIDYSGWTIRALKKEAQNRKLSKYSSLTKNQLISRLTA